MDSSTTITCQCGAKIRLPEDRANRSFRCPSCEQGLAVTADLKLLNSVTLDAGRDALCPICQSDIGVSEDCVTCPSCDQVHHRECWSEVGGCGTYGCDQASIIDKSEASVQAPLTAWGDTKSCPACGEKIKSIALRCRYCQTDFETVDPMSAGDLRRQGKLSDELESMKRWVTGIFICSLLGLCAPLMLLIALGYILPRRDKLKRCGPLFSIMGWTAIVLSAIYSALMLLFVVVSEI